MNITDRQPVPSRLTTVNDDIEVIPFVQPLREGATGARHLCQRLFDLFADLFDLSKIRPQHSDADRASHTGGDHLGACLNRHPPDVRKAWNPQLRIHLVQQAVPRYPGPPLGLWLERHGDFGHAGKRGIGGRGCLPHLPEGVFDFGKGHQ